MNDNQKMSAKQQASMREFRRKNLLWNDMSFAASEAYNRLRTNLVLSFADDDEEARVIGVTSTEHAEGKSVTSINIAAAFAKANYKTLLLEGDLRLPVIAKYLGLQENIGISDLLTGLAAFKDLVQNDVGIENLDVVACGRIPPNPSELLSSKRMEAVMKVLRQHYDYIVIDLPPVGAVSDPLVFSKYLNGMVVVVRHNVTNQPVLADVIRQLQYAGIRILGFVYNDADLSASKYKKRYYKNYYYYSSSGKEKSRSDQK